QANGEARRRRAAVARLLELRHVQERRGAGRRLLQLGARPVKREWLLGWEARLLVLITAVLVVFGLASVYAASSVLVERGHTLGTTRVLDQLIGALIGAILLVLASRL